MTINILLPMSGRGLRMQEEFNDPKPLILIEGKPMVIRVLESLQSIITTDANIILIAQQAHVDKYPHIFNELKTRFNANIVTVNHVTDGAACSVLAARKLIQNDNPLFISNADQILDMDYTTLMDDFYARKLAGSIVTFTHDSPSLSYVKLDNNEYVIDIAEKKVISNYATAGIYLFQSGKQFINATVDMIANADKANNEYYVAPAYKYIINDNSNKVGIINIEASKVHDLGKPDLLKQYIRLLHEHKL